MLSDIMEHLGKVGKRQPSFLIMVEHLLCCENPFVIETGTMRQADNYEGDGMSTLLWHNVLEVLQKGKYVSIDIDPISSEFARETLELDIRDKSIQTSDSVEWLQKNLKFQKQPIDLLYLDSFDLEFPDPTAAFLHTMFEFMTAKQYLASNALICVDDNIKVVKDDGPEEIFVSKGEYIRQYFEKIGNPPIHSEYQIIWRNKV